MKEREKQIIKEIAIKAGGILKSYFRKKISISYKGDIDPVTVADRKSEKFIIKNLKRYFPDASILSEEFGFEKVKGDFLFIIDPLDGTVNFSHKFPVYAISIALLYKNNLIYGLIYDVERNEIFEAEKGKGAYLNGKRIHVSSKKRIERSLLATGFPYYVWKKPRRVIKIFKNILKHAQGVRRLGAATIDLAWVACGRLDGFWEEGLKVWDTIAGKIIVEEAEGKVTDYRGKKYDLNSNTIVASNGFIHNQILELIK